MKREVIFTLATTILPMHAIAKEDSHNPHGVVSDKIITEQRSKLAENTKGKGFGPQSPRDIDAAAGNNLRLFSDAPVSQEMNLCNIHRHCLHIE